MEKRYLNTLKNSLVFQKKNIIFKFINERSKSSFLYFQKNKTILFSFLIFILFIDCKSEIAEQCKQVCQFSYTCIEKNQTNTLLTQKDREGFEIQCFNTCTMLQDEFLICHKKNSQSCEKYYSCLIDSDIFQ